MFNTERVNKINSVKIIIDANTSLKDNRIFTYDLANPANVHINFEIENEGFCNYKIDIEKCTPALTIE